MEGTNGRESNEEELKVSEERGEGGEEERERRGRL